MTNRSQSPIAMLVGAAVLALLAVPAEAGECPDGKIMADATSPGPMAPKDVTDDVIASIDLTQEYGVPGRLLRMRKLVIQPGGIVPWHSHAERPANIYVIEGEIVEHRSNCAVPIVHKTGEVVAEEGMIFHWWKNEGSKPAVLLSADLLPPQGKPADSM